MLIGPETTTVPVTFSWPQWSSDGKYLLYQKASGPSGGSVWAVPTNGDKKPFLVVQSQGQQGTIVYFRLSPEGKWLAYSSTESGREEVYVTSFPGGNGRWQISQNGGTSPVWRGDGKEPYFGEFSGAQTQMLAVEIITTDDQFQTPNYRRLFPVNHVLAGGNSSFDVSRDGHRFLLPIQPEAQAAPVSLTLNWPKKLGK